MTLRGFIAGAISGMSTGRESYASGLGLGLFESLVAPYLGALFQDPVIFFILIPGRVVQSRRSLGGSRRA